MSMLQENQASEVAPQRAVEVAEEAVFPAKQPSGSVALLHVVVATFGAVAVIAIGWSLMWAANVRLVPNPAEEARLARLAERQRVLARYEFLGPAKPAIDAVAFTRGKQLYALACVACHGTEGRGVANLGKDLLTSDFVNQLSDKDLTAFIVKGRGVEDPRNTTRVPMPAKGGRSDFTDADIADVVSFLRGLQDPRRAPEEPLPNVVLAQSLVQPKAEPTKPMASDVAQVALNHKVDAEAAVRGKKVYSSCLACHGKDGLGVKNMGKDLVHSSFVAKLSNEELVAFIKKGRDPSDPLNTTKLAMPAKGGNPALKDAQLADVVQYIRSLQAASLPKKP